MATERRTLVFDLLDPDRGLLPEIQKLAKDSFDLDSVINAAQELKYIGGIRRVIEAEAKEPTEESVVDIYRVADQIRQAIARHDS